jgi:hypothetical protein
LTKGISYHRHLESEAPSHSITTCSSPLPGGVDGKKQKVSGKVFCFSLKKRINQKFQAKKKERKLFLLSFWYGREKNGNESLRTSRHPSGPLLFWKEKVSREKLGNLSEL